MKENTQHMSITSILDDVKKKQVILFLLMFTLIFIRFCYYGLEYYHQLDDYIQYSNYAQDNTPLKTIKSLGVLAARPLAGVMDILIWSQFFSVMIIPVAIISALFAASAMLFHNVWRQHFGTGNVFLIVYSLLPLGIEGTYWVSASSRIVLGLFFAAVSLYYFDQWCETGKKRYVVTYALTQAVCYGFYEQMLVLSLTMTILVAFLYYKQHRKRALWGLLSFLFVAIYFFLTSLVKNSIVHSSRLSLVPPFGNIYFNRILPNVFSQVVDAFGKGAFYTLVKGAWRGFHMIFNDKSILYTLVIIILCLAYYYIANKDTTEQAVKNDMAKNKHQGNITIVSSVRVSLVYGLLMALAPVSIFFVIENAWFSLRGTVASFCGLALLIDTIIQLIFSKFKAGKRVLSVLSSIFIFICCIASVSEIHDYRATTLADRHIIALIADKLEEDGNLRRGLNIAVLNIEPSYLDNQNFLYHEHIYGVTESAWGLSGALESRVGYYNRPRVAPMRMGVMYYPWNSETSRMTNFDFVYVYLSDEIQNVFVESMSEFEFVLTDSHGNYLGRVWEENLYGYFFLG